MMTKKKMKDQIGVMKWETLKILTRLSLQMKLAIGCMMKRAKDSFQKKKTFSPMEIGSRENLIYLELCQCQERQGCRNVAILHILIRSHCYFCCDLKVAKMSQCDLKNFFLLLIILFISSPSTKFSNRYLCYKLND